MSPLHQTELYKIPAFVLQNIVTYFDIIHVNNFTLYICLSNINKMPSLASFVFFTNYKTLSIFFGQNCECEALFFLLFYNLSKMGYFLLFFSLLYSSLSRQDRIILQVTFRVLYVANKSSSSTLGDMK